MRRYFDGLEATADWYVSTLTPGLHGKPILKGFESEGDALDYARARVKAGPDLKKGGKAYYVIQGDGEPVYRVVRATQLIRTRSAMETYPATVLLVQKRNPKANNPRELWIPDMPHTIQLPGAERAQDLRHRAVSRNVKHVRIPAQTKEEFEAENRAQIERLAEEYRWLRRGSPKKD